MSVQPCFEVRSTLRQKLVGQSHASRDFTSRKHHQQPSPLNTNKTTAAMPTPTQPQQPTGEDKRRAARETIDILHSISSLLNTHLDRQSLSYCVSLIENGVNPEALAVSSTRLLLMRVRG